jgi:hypothetical protein
MNPQTKSGFRPQVRSLQSHELIPIKERPFKYSHMYITSVAADLRTQRISRSF